MRVAALGASAEIAGYGLVGALLCPAEDVVQAHAAWHALPDDVGLVILTSPAATALFGDHSSGTPRMEFRPAGRAGATGERLVAVMPA